jgi:hypothetical protein
LVFVLNMPEIATKPKIIYKKVFYSFLKFKTIVREF